jgi:AcrR family transcriptional regulator
MRRNKKKQQIIDAAKVVVSERGSTNASLQAIADEAGMSKGALYYHYSSKSTIFYDIMDQVSSRAKQLIIDTQTKNMSKEEITTAMKDIFRVTAADSPESRLFIHLVHEGILGDEQLAEKFKDKYEQWVSSIEEILVTLNNIPKSPQTRLLAILVEAAIDGFILKNILGVQEEENDRVLDMIGELDLGKIIALLKGDLS